MNTQDIVTRVTSMKIGRDYDHDRKALVDVTTVGLTQTVGPFRDLQLQVQIPVGHPNPFHLDQRVCLSIEPAAAAIDAPAREPLPLEPTHAPMPQGDGDSRGLSEVSGYSTTMLEARPGPSLMARCGNADLREDFAMAGAR